MKFKLSEAPKDEKIKEGFKELPVEEIAQKI